MHLNLWDMDKGNLHKKTVLGAQTEFGGAVYY